MNQDSYDSSFLYLTFADRYQNGFRVFDLALYNSEGKKADAIPVLSGSALRQYSRFIHPSKDYAGSGNPLPEGIYDLGSLEDSISSGKESWGEGIGRYWISVDSRFNVNNRSSFGIHDDDNREYSPGSAGCICPFASKQMGTILKWIKQQARPSFLICNLNTGFLSEKGIKYPGPKISVPNDTMFSGYQEASDFIKGKEFLSLFAYPDPLTNGKPFTIGWGNTYYSDGSPVGENDTITAKAADALFDYWLKIVWKELENTVHFWNEMSKGQRAALASLAYNTGWTVADGNHDTLDACLKRKADWSKVPSAFSLYVNAGTRVEAGLKQRRHEEGLLWNS